MVSTCYAVKEVFCVKIILFLLLLFATNSVGFSQIIGGASERIWVSQERNPSANLYSKNTPVGNYPVLDQHQGPVRDLLKSLSQETAGTLFLVIRPKKDSISAARLFKFGSVEVFRDSVRVDNHAAPIKRIGGEPAIVKINFQGRPRRIWSRRGYWAGHEADLAEIIFYKSILNDSIARIVESFLAIKYSINITANSRPKFRNYYSISNDVWWDADLDSLYNKEVMGLGRMDGIGFYQSQTYTANTRDVRISLDSATSFSEMPPVSIEDSSIIIIAKGNDFLKPQCGGDPTYTLFKLKGFNWRSSAQKLLIRIDTVLKLQNMVFTNGLQFDSVRVKLDSSGTMLQVPLHNLLSSTPYYIQGDLPADSCQNISHLVANNCDSLGNNSIHIHTAAAVLPASFELVELATGRSFTKNITASVATLSNLAVGSYELTVKNQNGLLMHRIFSLNECPNLLVTRGSQSGTTTDNHLQWVFSEGDKYLNPISNSIEDIPTFNNGRIVLKGSGNWSKDSTLLKDGQASELRTGKALDIYPNPLDYGQEINLKFHNLNDHRFTIQVLDSKGALMKQDEFTPSAGSLEYSYRFPQAGTYLIRVFSEVHGVSKTIIVQ